MDQNEPKIETRLPSLKELKLPSYLTLRKGVKIHENGIRIEAQFSDIKLDAGHLKKYSAFFGFKEKVPLPYFYLLAQRAQVKLMLDKKFTIAIPGLIHLSNSMQKLGIYDPNLSLKIKASVQVESKSEGSIIPVFFIDFWQKGNKIVSCKSVYLARRKKKKKGSSKLERLEKLTPFKNIENWEIPRNLGSLYGKASQDTNPIHHSKLFAKFIGFEGSILQGWHAVSKMIKERQEGKETSFKSIHVDFKSPILLPSTIQVEWEYSSENELIYQMRNISSQKLVLEGSFAT